ncbi:MAG TPA: trigger factor [Bacteroidales bacterium]|nr:trigger factor [Bacteroidales bacterium]
MLNKMKISIEKVDQLNAIIQVDIKKEDYADQVDKALRTLRKKINLPGFRKGNIPMTIMIQRYGKSVIVEEVHKLLSEKLTSYIAENNLKIFGEPLACKTKKNIANWENPEDFTFFLDIAYIPEIEIEIDKSLTTTQYKIAPDEKIINDYIKNYQHKFGEYKEIDSVDTNHMVYGDFQQIDTSGQIVENGINVKDALIVPRYIQDESVKEKFLKLKKGDTIIFNPLQSIKNETELSHLFNIDKSKIKSLDSDFLFVITKITKFEPAEVDATLFEKIYGKNEIKDESEFREKIKQEVENNLVHESNYQFKIDLKKDILKKFPINLPEEFLKRWLLETSENKEKITEEVLEKEFPIFADNLKWSIILDVLAKKLDIKVSEEETTQEAIVYTRQQLYQYGLYQITDEQVAEYAQEILKNKNEINKIIERVRERKVIDKIKSMITIKDKKISLDSFNKLLEKKK